MVDDDVAAPARGMRGRQVRQDLGQLTEP